MNKYTMTLKLYAHKNEWLKNQPLFGMETEKVCLGACLVQSLA